MIYLIKPLTKRMLADLRRGRARELTENKRKICSIEYYKRSLFGLYSRGLVNTKIIEDNGRKIVQIYTTSAGINFLNCYDEDFKLLQGQ